ncbi:MAG: indolepyruvate ferredoxin oxidoreductase family protein [Rhodobacteraceae bacterium]|nr:indolepyruvate ferredoxin oxidoreductase family protein [Paracoccaceae bacterium]
MDLQPVSLADKLDLSKKTVLLNGTQALVRLMMMQKQRDKDAGHNTAGYVSGYRGSPVGAVDMQMQRAESQLTASDIKFEAGLNEDIAATAHWGAQSAGLRGDGKFEGVFGLWYGKGPGVDRSGDVFRHANMAGTAALGGVVAVMGDDHTAESSTTLHQSEFAFVDALMPILSPAGVQEMLDYGIYGYALSRYCGAWVGLKALKDTIEVTQVVDGNADRIQVRLPDDFDMPKGGLNIRLADDRAEQEARIHDHKRFAAEAFARANKLDKRMHGKAGARIGIVSSGKSWLDTAHALETLGIDEAQAEALGITTYKVAMVWPLDTQSFREWAEDLELIIVVEEKRKLLEVQIKEAIFNDRKGRRVIGWKKENGDLLFTVKGALNPILVAKKLAETLTEEGASNDKLTAAAAALEAASLPDNSAPLAQRIPYFCSGCPHNSSTKVPEGSRAYAGIGCHYMVQWMDRDTLGFTQMGGEGANWIGEAPFSKTGHMFQNLGDGTYNHSGSLAIRGALAAGTNITYKVLYNDAVAMTGGQANEGGLDAPRIAAELVAMGIKKLVVVYDEKEDIDKAAFPKGIEMAERAELDRVQRELREIEGVTAILYVQTCAAEKRRRRKRGTFPDIDKRVFINPAVCEGCGDCGVQSNCVSILPLETEFGRKRMIDQSSCNKDFSCINGFCPSFVTLEGATPKKPALAELDLPDLPMPEIPAINGTFNIVATGVGGTGIVTVGALLAMAAHLEGKGAGMMEMAGLAQKGGAVLVHCRISEKPEDIKAVRVAQGEADAVIGGDIVATAGPSTLSLMQRGKTGVVCNAHQIITGEFTKNTEFKLPVDELEVAIEGRIGAEALAMMDATALAEKYLGDAIFANVLMMGAAWQAGLLPLSLEALEKAIELNKAGVEGNLKALQIGRWAVAFPEQVQPAEAAAETPSLEQIIETRATHLGKYQGGGLARKYRKRIAKVSDPELAEAMALGYHKLLSYKDEYEVARLHVETLEAAVEASFDNVKAMRFHLAPPLFSKKDTNGHLIKKEYGPAMLGRFKMLAKLKRLRGTPLDPFGRTAERKMERALIKQYQKDMKEVELLFSDENPDIAIALAKLPLSIKGFGHVKMRNAEAAAKEREALLAALRQPSPPLQQAAE